MWDTNRIETTDPKTIKRVDILASPMYAGPCPLQHIYAPGFPVFLDKELLGYPCGHCITDFIQLLRISNPLVEIWDNRRALYN